MEEVMDIIHITNKGKILDTLERYYIYRQKMSNNQINDKLTVKPSAIFETIVNEYPYRVVFLSRRAAARSRVLASVIPGREWFSWNLSF